MGRSTDIDGTLRQYLLGDLSPGLRDELELRYFQDKALHEELLAQEDELIDEYVREHLAPGDRERFESFFLVSPERREKLQFARALAKFAEQRPRVVPERRYSSAFLAFFTSRRRGGWVLATAAALITIGLTVWIGHSNRRAEVSQGLTAEASKTEIGSSAPPRPQTSAQPKTPDQTAIATQHSGNGTAHPPKSRGPSIISLVLLPGVRSSGGRTNVLSIPPGRHEVRLVVTLPAEGYSSYKARVKNVDTGDDLEAASVTFSSEGLGEQRVTAVFDSASFVPGDYILRVAGTNAEGDNQLAAYSLKVVILLGK